MSTTKQALRLGRRVGLGLACCIALASPVLILQIAGAAPADRVSVQKSESPLQSGSRLSLGAQASISRTIGRDDRSYRVLPGRPLRLANQEHGLTVRFTASRVELRSGRGQLGLALSGYGHGRSLRRVGSVVPVGSANRVEYRRGPLVEWYDNGPLGLEQGFRLAARPNGGHGPLTISLALAAPNARADRDRRGIEFLGTGLRYEGLTATDGTGQTLRSWLELAGERLQIHVDDRGARYPVTIDPFFQQDAKLRSSDAVPDGQFGFAVAVSGDTVAVGAWAQDAGQGAVYVFTKPANAWTGTLTETAKLTTAAAQGGALFGWSVAISGDTIVAGERDGAAYVFVKPAGGWQNGTETAKLTQSDAELHDFFGTSVAISGDANTIVVGAPVEVGFSEKPGAAYVFVKPAGGWQDATETAKLVESDAQPGDGLGSSVAISGDTVVAGAPGGLPGAIAAAYVFVESPGGWQDETQLARLTPSVGGPNPIFGSSLAISEDTIVVGAATDTVAGHVAQGSAYVFVRPAGGWQDGTEQARLTASDGAQSDYFGWSTAIWDETVVVGTMGSDKTYVFARPAAGWHDETEQQELNASDQQLPAAFGRSVAISGETIVVGAPDADRPAPFAPGPGAAYVFGPDTTPPTVSCSATPATLWPPDHQLATVTTSVQVSDQGSGAAGFTLVSVTSSQPDTGASFGPFANDIQDWTLNTPDTNGELREERYGTARTYTFTYEGKDNAGNTSTCTAAVTVPLNGP